MPIILMFSLQIGDYEYKKLCRRAKSSTPKGPLYFYGSVVFLQLIFSDTRLGRRENKRSFSALNEYEPTIRET